MELFRRIAQQLVKESPQPIISQEKDLFHLMDRETQLSMIAVTEQAARDSFLQGNVEQGLYFLQKAGEWEEQLANQV